MEKTAVGFNCNLTPLSPHTHCSSKWTDMSPADGWVKNRRWATKHSILQATKPSTRFLTSVLKKSEKKKRWKCELTQGQRFEVTVEDGKHHEHVYKSRKVSLY